jgi:TPR repeat protein
MMCGPLDTTSTDLRNCKEAIRILQKKSLAGDPYADFYLSMAYSNGISVAPDSAVSFNYMLKAAKGGDKAALYYVGASYLFGMGTPVDVENALTWLGKSAYSGDINAQFMLGQFYSEQKYGHQNFKLSYIWYDVANMGGMTSAKPLLDVISALLPSKEQQSAQETAQSLYMELDAKTLTP